ncbi:MAG TPA: M20/M25/M40 family metallo-hydrolase [Streptosporangiaceae bacterium]|nr:M20/M25/M40 family metallo-hydrolase [Streptosporangiaceae bacterium]
MDEVTAALRYARSHQAATLRRLLTLLRFPTVSAEPRHAPDMSACAAWLARMLGRIGLTDVRVWRGQVAPVVTAAWHGSRGGPTVLVYGHYDVQPVEPLTAWATDPFRPVRKGPHLYARGASDDKGQLMAHLAAIEAWLATSARLPVNLRLILDGEEEIGSPTLVAAVAAGWRPLAADVALVSDTWMLAPCAPVLITGLRGALGASLEVSGPRRDLHAGAFGGAVTNPAEVLASLVASLHDKAGRVAVAGFYDQVRPMTDKERQHLARVGPSDSAMLAPAGTALGHGEPGFSAFERVTRRPAVMVTDLCTSGEGRTVVPARATADLNVRLAAGQEPARIAALLRRHLRARIPPGMHARLRIRSRCPPYTLDPRAPVVRAVRSACRNVFGQEPALLPSGGSIPFVSTLAAARPIDVALLGFGLPDDAAHAPNERLYLPNLCRGTDACIELYQHLGGG